MTCDVARDLLVDEQEGLLDTDERAALRVHLASCDDCRAERDALIRDYAVLNRGLHAMTDPITPSAHFWQGLNEGLDAVDAERAAAPVRPAHRPRWTGRRPVISALAAALVAGLIATGAPQNAWAALRHLLYFIPGIGGQIEATALVATVPASTANADGMLTVTALISGRQSTLLAYTATGQGLAAGGVPVADAVDAVLVDGAGHRYTPTYVLPATRDLVHGTPRLEGLLAFPALPRATTLVRLQVARLPYTPSLARPWSLTLPLRTASSGAAQTSRPVDRSDAHGGVRLTVTDVTMAGGTTVVDMDARVEGGRYAGGRVVSLTPEAATGPFAPTLTVDRLVEAPPLPALLPPSVRQGVQPQPEFAYPTAPTPSKAMTLTVPAVELRLPIHATLTAQAAADGPRPIALGAVSLSITRSEVVTPSAALGLDGGARLRLTFAFPPAGASDAVRSVDVVVGGTGYTVDRADPHLDLPLTPGQRVVALTVQNPVVALQGPWSIALSGT